MWPIMLDLRGLVLGFEVLYVQGHFEFSLICFWRVDDHKFGLEVNAINDKGDGLYMSIFDNFEFWAFFSNLIFRNSILSQECFKLRNGNFSDEIVYQFLAGDIFQITSNFGAAYNSMNNLNMIVIRSTDSNNTTSCSCGCGNKEWGRSHTVFQKIINYRLPFWCFELIRANFFSYYLSQKFRIHLSRNLIK